MLPLSENFRKESGGNVLKGGVYTPSDNANYFSDDARLAWFDVCRNDITLLYLTSNSLSLSTLQR